MNVSGASDPVRGPRLQERGTGPAAPIGVWFEFADAGRRGHAGVAHSHSGAELPAAREQEAREEAAAEAAEKGEAAAAARSLPARLFARPQTRGSNKARGITTGDASCEIVMSNKHAAMRTNMSNK